MLTALIDTLFEIMQSQEQKKSIEYSKHSWAFAHLLYAEPVMPKWIDISTHLCIFSTGNKENTLNQFAMNSSLYNQTDFF